MIYFEFIFIIIELILIIKYYLKKIYYEQVLKVKKSSKKVCELFALNNTYEKLFVPIFQKNKKYIYKVNSKRALENIKLYTIVVSALKQNSKELYSDFIIAQNNYNYYREYLNLYNNIVLKANQMEHTVINMEEKKYAKIENYLLNMHKINEPYDLNAIVLATYTSPRGRNYYEKKNIFDFFEINELIKIIIKENNYKNTVKYERSLMNSRLRYEVLKKDGYRCQICGATSDDGVKMHIDHIIPISKGGKTEFNNLQTLCERCNLGKSNI